MQQIFIFRFFYINSMANYTLIHIMTAYNILPQYIFFSIFIVNVLNIPSDFTFTYGKTSKLVLNKFNFHINNSKTRLLKIAAVLLVRRDGHMFLKHQSDDSATQFDRLLLYLHIVQNLYKIHLRHLEQFCLCAV